MIKRLVWTIILLTPSVLAGVIAIFDTESGAAGQLFNAGAAVNWTWDSIVEFVHLFNVDERDFWEFLKSVILASFFIAPLIFVWRGLFFIEWIPIVGHAFRAIVIAFIILLPGIFQILVNNEIAVGNNFIEEFGLYMQTIVLALALIGLWLPKSITVRNKK